jgi:hypothetical protein
MGTGNQILLSKSNARGGLWKLRTFASATQYVGDIHVLLDRRIWDYLSIEVFSL